MITRIVKLTLLPTEIDLFISIFQQKKDFILAFDGCESVRLIQDIKSANVVFTVSTWLQEEDLENYRSSQTFATTWKQVKPLFLAKAEAWSTIDK